MTLTETAKTLPPRKPSNAEKPVKPVDRLQTKAKSKQDKVLALLNAPDGTTLKAIVKATGWQQHSVRGFLAGVVRKKLNLNLVSKVIGEDRVYRITRKAVGKPGAASKAR